MSVNKERLKLGIEALRSGKYVQGQRALAPVERDSLSGKNQQRYCCLGVLCEAAIDNGLDNVVRYPGIFQIGYDNTMEDSMVEYSVLPEPVRAWYGFDLKVPCVVTDEEAGTNAEVTALNDEEGWDFNQIADAFERTFIDVEDE